MRMKKALLLLLAIPAIGIAMIPVVDVGAIAKEVANGLTLAKQLVQLASMYSHLVDQAKYMVNTIGQWGSVHRVLGQFGASDATGLNGQWLNALNSGNNSNAGYNRLVSAVNPYLVGMPVVFQPAANRRIAQTERIDGQVAEAGGVLGSYTALSADFSARLKKLAASATSSLSADNTAAALAQKQTAATLLAIEGAGVQTDLLRYMLAQNNERMIQQREAIAAQVNADAQFYLTAESVLAQHVHTLTDGYRSMRLP